jgi:hypothetical protein
MAKPRIKADELPSNNKTVPNRVVSRGVRIGNDDVSNKMRTVGNSLFDTVILPAIKSLLYDTFMNGLSMVIFQGDNNPAARGRRTSYNRQYSPRRSTSRRSIYREERRQMLPNRRVEQVEEVLQDLYFDYREDAQLVLAALHDSIQEYGKATVGDFYALAGKNTNYTHQSWGWDDLSGVTIHGTPDGFVIGLPSLVYFS